MLYLAGVNHFDPMGREHVANWLCSLVERHSFPPSFVAVEFDSAVFETIRARRPFYRESIRRLWPAVPESDLEHFEHSLGYEGDVHLDCLHGTDVIWLDEGRALPAEVVEQHVLQRLKVLRYFESRNSLMLPGVVSEQVQPFTRAGVFSEDRSRRFAGRILARVSAQGWEWGIAITGASHASERFETSMRRLLEKAGIPCEARLFCRLD